MRVLGIETSCDETAAAVVEETGDLDRPWRVRASVVASQVAVHREWGGIVPELSARQHVRDICGVVRQALDASGGGFDAIAVTQGPGLVGSLLVGLAFAKGLAWARSVPLVPVHHLGGHIESLVLEHGEMPLASVVLVVSGGHTNLYRIERPGRYELLGRTRDDAAGEAFDKVAKLLGLGYPGGPAIDLIARHGNDRAVPFPKTRLTHADRNAPHLAGRRDFSFSGLKTSVVRHVAARRAELGVDGAHPLPFAEVADIAASFQRVVVETLLDRLFEAARWYDARSVGIAGGVSANSRLREEAASRGASRGLPVFVPSLALSTDNAAMIAAAGLRRYRAGVAGGLDLNADPSLPLHAA
ncbi:MAG: tRNA (adenosine(37)-N6)-threonylcarbamoyltransferase complex transferase subunit TsaD [Acidobacteria bacterium RIFCSPLOWO2_02_FULL_68_18]|nr:MAG: tRNA (adenosine(37)-N6)-threonylcarbamoyltransferase complex transferase subunit TsaD [Acidobacteria bacterium RIFCSPLOWO2_02_FULL_68_18]OFW51521.1 MAG: tRNA (adenosine(37)-N6)-threonylcarbamoyltransferase complex transferase subunit TsaD [Acidobacteria bacterium RIFCSPLOWO2_12_FULL_68_19]